MNATDVIANQVKLIHGRLSGVAAATPEEWLARPLPGENRVGFMAWHMVATRDWLARSMLQGARPIAWDAPFAGTGIATCEIPFGMSLEEADAIAEATTPGEVVAYSAAVTGELLHWLNAADDARLAAPSASAASHWDLSRRYAEAGYHEEIDREDMTMWPVWQLFSRPALLHCANHLTEIDVARKAVKGAGR